MTYKIIHPIGVLALALCLRYPIPFEIGARCIYTMFNEAYRLFSLYDIFLLFIAAEWKSSVIVKRKLSAQTNTNKIYSYLYSGWHNIACRHVMHVHNCQMERI